MSEEITTLGEVISIAGGGTPSTDVKAYWNGDIPWVSPKDMKFDEIGNSIDKITKEAIKNSAANLIPVNSTLVVVRSGILARTVPIAITTCPLTINQDIKALCPKAFVDPHYLRYFMIASESALLKLVTRGATVHRLSTDSLRSLRFVNRSLREQRRIVAILDEAFEGIATVTANAVRNLANARAIFDGGLDSIFLLRGERWVDEPLSRHVKFIDYRGKTPLKSRSGVRLITAKNVKKGYIQRTPEEFVDQKTYLAWMSRGFPAKGDVLFTTEAPLGNVAQLDTDETVAIGQRLITLQPEAAVLDRTFLKYMLLSKPLQEAILKQGTGATVQGIKAKLLKAIPIFYPREILEQLSVVERLDLLSEQTQKLEKLFRRKLMVLSELKQSLLERAFSGELTSLPSNALDAAAE